MLIQQEIDAAYPFHVQRWASGHWAFVCACTSSWMAQTIAEALAVDSYNEYRAVTIRWAKTIEVVEDRK